MNVAIVGGGVVGALTALRLCQVGWSITLYDDMRAGAATRAASGMLSMLPPWHGDGAWLPWLKGSLVAYEKLQADLLKRKIADCDLRLMTAQVWSREPPAQVNARAAAMDLAVSVVQGKHSGLDGAYHGYMIAKLGRLEPAKLLEGVHELFLQSGGVRLQPCKVHQIEPQPHGVRLLSDAGSKSFDYVVLCCGSWTEALFKSSSFRPQVVPVKGQLLQLEVEPTPYTGIQIFPQQYLINLGSKAVVGTTLEYQGYNTHPSQHHRGCLLKFALRLGLKPKKVMAHTVGLRPKSRQRMPYLGFVPGQKRVLCSSGYHRVGVAAAPNAAKWCHRMLCEAAAGSP